MARDAAELKEVLQSVSTMLKPFYAQVNLSALQPPFLGYRDHYSRLALRQQAGGRTERTQHSHLLPAKVCCRCNHCTAGSVHIPHTLNEHAAQLVAILGGIGCTCLFDILLGAAFAQMPDRIVMVAADDQCKALCELGCHGGFAVSRGAISRPGGSMAQVQAPTSAWAGLR